MHYIRAAIGAGALILMNGSGVLLFTQASGFLKWIGYFNYIVAALGIYFIALQYMETDFFKNLDRKSDTIQESTTHE